MSSQFDKIFVWGFAVIIIATIIGGLMVIGGPQKARDHKIDTKRLSNMQMTARVISCYADDIGGLPEIITPVKQALENKNISQAKKPQCTNLTWETDPVTLADFEFKRLSQYSFELCGVFIRKASENQRRVPYNYNDNRAILDVTVSREHPGLFCYKAKNWK